MTSPLYAVIPVWVVLHLLFLQVNPRFAIGGSLHIIYINTAKVITAYGGIEPLMKALQKLTYKMADMGVNFAAGETGIYAQYQSACRELNLDPILLTYIFRDDSGVPYKS